MLKGGLLRCDRDKVLVWKHCLNYMFTVKNVLVLLNFLKIHYLWALEIV